MEDFRFELSRPSAFRRLAALLVMVFVAGCSNGTSSSLPVTPAGTSAGPLALGPLGRKRGAARFVVRIPHRKKKRRPSFISPSTKSLRLLVIPQRGGTPVADRTINLTPQSPGCATVSGETQCSISITLLRGDYLATVDTFDRVDAGGALLSKAQSVAFSVTATTASIGLTLDAVPHGLTVASGSYAILGTQTSGFSIYGGATAALIVNATDADGNTIVGPGSPTYRGAVQTGTGWALQTPPPAAPNALGVKPPGQSGAQATINVTASSADPTICQEPGAVCSTSLTITNHTQRIFVANGSNGSPGTSGDVTAYDPPYTSAPSLTITSGTSQPQVVFLDPFANLIVGQCDASCSHTSPDRIEIYAPPYTSSATTTITTGVSEMLDLAMDDADDLAVSYINAGQVAIYVPPYTGAPTVMSGLVNPTQMIFDPSANLIVGSAFGAGSVSLWPSPYVGPPTSIGPSGTNAGSIAMDANHNLFVANGLSDDVTVFAPPYTGSPIQTISASQPSRVLLDPISGNLFVMSGSGNTVEVFAPPYTAQPTTITTGISFPLDMTIDVVGNLFVANSSGRSVTVYAPPYTGAPVTIGSSVFTPQSLALTPIATATHAPTPSP
jgi:hypothetical protein